jgi:outer membrane protein W
MKKYILSLLFISFAFIGKQTFAQVGQGLFVGGSLGITSSSGKTTTTTTTGNSSSITERDNPKNSSFSIMPRVGYFFTDNIGAGLMLGYRSTSTQSITSGAGGSTTTTTTKAGMFNVGLFGRYTQQLGDSDFYIYGDLGFGIGSGNSKISVETKTISSTTTVETDGPKVSETTIAISPGILYFPTKKIGLEASLGNIFAYMATKETTENTISGTTTKIVDKNSEIHVFNVNSLGFTFGLNFYLNRE